MKENEIKFLIKKLNKKTLSYIFLELIIYS